MFYSMQALVSHQIRHFKQAFAQADDLPFKSVLSTASLTKIAEETGSYRDKVYFPLTTLLAFVGQTLSADHSCKDTVARVLADRLAQGLPPCSVNTGPYCKARKRLSETLMSEAVKTSGNQLHQQAPAHWKWRGFSVVLVDGTTVSMPDTLANQSAFPQEGNQKAGLGFPLARLVGLISLACGTVMDYTLSPYQGKLTGELSLLKLMLGSLSPGELVLADRYYCTYALVAILLQRGIPAVFKNHRQRKSDFRIGKKLGEKDHLITWLKPKTKPIWMEQADYETLPDSLQLRELKVGGQVIITTLLDAKNYHKQEVAVLYKRRWLMELDLRTIKSDMQMGILRCKTPDMVKKEIAAHLLAYNLIRTTLAQAALLHSLHPRAISFKGAMQLLNAFRSYLMSVTGEALMDYYFTLLKAIADTSIGGRIRPPEPRAIKRRPKGYPFLTVPREEARQKLYRC